MTGPPFGLRTNTDAVMDTVRGMVAAMDRLEAGEELPPVHLLTGAPTTLRDLAAMAMALVGKRLISEICHPPKYGGIRTPNPLQFGVPDLMPLVVARDCRPAAG